MHIGFALGEGKVNRLLGTLNSNSMIPGVQTDYHSYVPYILRISRTFVLCVYIERKRESERERDRERERGREKEKKETKKERERAREGE